MVNICKYIELYLVQPMPVSPSWVSGISACHFRKCQSFDKLWIFPVWPATFKYRWAVQSENHKTLSTLQPAGMLIPFQSFVGFLLLDLCFFFHHIVPQVRLSIWHFQNSSPLLLNLRYTEKGDLPEHFASTFSLVMLSSHESEHTKLMASLIINFLLAVF